MRENGIRYDELAKETNINESRIHQLARGVSNPTEDELLNIDDVMYTKYGLHINPSSFVRFDAKETERIMPAKPESEAEPIIPVAPVRQKVHRVVRKCVYRINQELIVGDNLMDCIGIFKHIHKSFNHEEPVPLIRTVEFIPGRMYDEELGAYVSVECELYMED